MAAAATKTYERYIALAPYHRAMGGMWGAGATEAEAIENLATTNGRSRPPRTYRLVRFTSHLPFAPPKREARAMEADAWVGRDGSINWLRCERAWLKE